LGFECLLEGVRVDRMQHFLCHLHLKAWVDVNLNAIQRPLVTDNGAGDYWFAVVALADDVVLE
jgi:hypothetical protein